MRRLRAVRRYGRDLGARLYHDERGILGTAAAIALALGTAGASVAGQVYGAKKTAGINQQAIEAEQAQHAASISAAEKQAEIQAALERERLAQEKAAFEARLAQEERARQERLELYRQQYEAYTAANQPWWNVGAGLYNDLYRMVGGPASALPVGQLPGPLSGPAPPTSVAASPMLPPGALPAPAPAGVPTAAPSRGRPFALQTVQARPLVPAATAKGPTLMDLLSLASVAGQGGSRNPLGFGTWYPGMPSLT